MMLACSSVCFSHAGWAASAALSPVPQLARHRRRDAPPPRRATASLPTLQLQATARGCHPCVGLISEIETCNFWFCKLCRFPCCSSCSPRPPRAALRCSRRWRRGAARPRPLAALYAWLVRSSRPTTLALHAIVYELPADLVDSLEAAVEDSLHIWSVIDTIDTTDTIDTSSTLRHFDTRHTRHVDTVRAPILSRSPSTLRRHSRHLDTGVNRHPLDTHSTLPRHRRHRRHFDTPGLNLRCGLPGPLQC